METIKKYWKEVLAVIVLILIVRGCVNNQEQVLKGESKQLKQQKELLQKQVDSLSLLRVKEKDSVFNVFAAKKVENERLNSTNKKLLSQIESIKKKRIEFKTPTDLEGFAVYFNSRYKTDENKVVENKVGLGDYTARDVTSELESGDECWQVDSVKTVLISNKDIELKNKDVEIKGFSLLLNSAEKEIKERENLQNKTDELNKNLNQQLKKRKLNNTLTKILIPVSFVVGVLIAK